MSGNVHASIQKWLVKSMPTFSQHCWISRSDAQQMLDEYAATCRLLRQILNGSNGIVLTSTEYDGELYWLDVNLPGEWVREAEEILDMKLPGTDSSTPDESWRWL